MDKEHVQSEFEVEAIVDGPRDGWFIVQWGPSYPGLSRHRKGSRQKPRFVPCNCNLCIPPCPELRVPEQELERSAPELLSRYKQTPKYKERVRQMEAAAVRRMQKAKR